MLENRVFFVVCCRPCWHWAECWPRGPLLPELWLKDTSARAGPWGLIWALGTVGQPNFLLAWMKSWISWRSNGIRITTVRSVLLLCRKHETCLVTWCHVPVYVFKVKSLLVTPEMFYRSMSITLVCKDLPSAVMKTIYQKKVFALQVYERGEQPGQS